MAGSFGLLTAALSHAMICHLARGARMENVSAASTVKGHMACRNKGKFVGDQRDFEYAAHPLVIDVPARGITQVEHTCPQCAKVVLLSVRSHFEATAGWWLQAIFFGLMAPVGLALLILIIVAPFNERFVNIFMLAIIGGGLIGSVFLTPDSIRRARRPRFADHVVILADSGNAVRDINNPEGPHQLIDSEAEKALS